MSPEEHLLRMMRELYGMKAAFIAVFGRFPQEPNAAEALTQMNNCLDGLEAAYKAGMAMTKACELAIKAVEQQK